jgi:TolB-like protein/DNA-binding winged helix-turn-helix (wHTH) protein/Tfp pilus assembly protein PilF
MTEPAGHTQLARAVLYRVGDLLIDTGRQRITRGEEVIALPKLSYELLLALVRAAPNLLSIDALMAEVWPRLVVSPETVSQRVKLLRDALGDDPRGPKYVEGLRGRGYRLIPIVQLEPAANETAQAEGSPVAAAAVIPVAAAALPDPAASAPAPPQNVAPPPFEPPRPRAHRRYLWAGLIVAALIGGVMGIRRLDLPQPKSPKTSVEVVEVQPRAVAVLPFDALSAGSDNELLALGMADAVLQQLASVPELIVIARSSSFALGKPIPGARAAGQALGARYLVEGNVQRVGKALRVNARLVDAAANQELWSLRVDRTIDDVFAVQDQIAQQVARQLEVTLHAHSAEYASFGTDAYLAFLKGRTRMATRRVADVEAAIREFTRATELAPSFAAALAELGYAKMQLASLSSDAQSQRSAWPEIRTLADRAIAIDPSAGEPYFLRAKYKLEVDHDAGGAESDLRRGLDLAPNFGPGLRFYANYLYEQKRYEETLAVLDRARLVDPLGAENHYLKGEVIRTALHGREEAAPLYLQALAVEPDFYPAYTRLAQVRYMQGRLAEAIKYGEKSIAIEPGVGWTRDRLVWFYVDIGDLAAARDVLRGYRPQSPERTINEALVCFRAGSVARAASLAQVSISQPEANDSGLAVRFAADAAVEQAIATHNPQPARRLILSIPDVRHEGDTVAVTGDSLSAVIQLATLDHFAGNRAAGDGLARRALAYVEQGGSAGLANDDELSRAILLALLGKDEDALTHLQQMIAQGRWIGWWVWLEKDPVFGRSRAAPRFHAISADANTWLHTQLELLGQMRVRGEVPARATAASAGGC